jgi:rhamnosyltransferase
MKVALIIPTLNASRHWKALYQGIRRQSLAPDQVIVVDSSSTDNTVVQARLSGCTVLQIDRREFNHGGTRQAAAQLAANADILIYLTQDAVPLGTEAFRRLVGAFTDRSIGAAYGRQLPRPNATAIEEHARLFNYPPLSQVRSLDSRAALGFKSIFFSNTFGAYRRDALFGIGGFSQDASFGEDTLAVAHLHRAGWKTAYIAEAAVEHSHAYSLQDEFRRYLNIGIFHRRELWLTEEFGAVKGEGLRFVLSELRYLLKRGPLELPSSLLRTLVKSAAYNIGRHEWKTTPIQNL